MARTKKSEKANEKDQNLGESMEDLGSTASEAGEQVQDVAANITDKVREQANERIASQKEQVVDTLETVSLLLHQAGEHAHQQDKEMLASYVDKAAGQVSRWTDTLREQDVTQLGKSAAEFARREPMLFVGGALTAGFLGARFLRSSAQNQGEESSGGQEWTQETSVDTSLPELPDAGYGSTSLPAYDVNQTTSTSSLGDTPDLMPESTGMLEDAEMSGLGDDVSQADVDPAAPMDIEVEIDIDDNNSGSL